MAFCELDEDMQVAEDFLKYLFGLFKLLFVHIALLIFFEYDASIASSNSSFVS
jgi:hypothetical protein